jgi:hypothetical protein
MALLKRKKKESQQPLLAEAASQSAAAEESPQESPQETAPEDSPSQTEGLTNTEPDLLRAVTLPPDDMLDTSLIGRTIKLAIAQNWEHDILTQQKETTYILYENQRGYSPPQFSNSRMFLFGKPYFSTNSLVQSFKFDPPPYQTTNTFLTAHPGTLDPCNPTPKAKWPPDALKLYYSSFTPRDSFLSMDSLQGYTCRWKEERWYVDMRGDVDEEGWEYAFYWNGKYKWFGGNWHGKAVLFHGFVRRRKWIREMQRIPVPIPFSLLTVE